MQPLLIYLAVWSMYATAFTQIWDTGMNRILLIVALFIGGLATLPEPAFAEDISKQQAASIAQSRYPGRVIDVKLIDNNTYRVKVLDNNGGMHIVIVNKQSGNIESAN